MSRCGTFLKYSNKMRGQRLKQTDAKVVAAPSLGNWQDDDILAYLKETIAGTYKKDGYELPSIHGAAFLAKPAEEKFLPSLAFRNNGNFMRISAPIRENTAN